MLLPHFSVAFTNCCRQGNGFRNRPFVVLPFCREYNCSTVQKSVYQAGRGGGDWGIVQGRTFTFYTNVIVFFLHAFYHQLYICVYHADLSLSLLLLPLAAGLEGGGATVLEPGLMDRVGNSPLPLGCCQRLRATFSSY